MLAEENYDLFDLVFSEYFEEDERAAVIAREKLWFSGRELAHVCRNANINNKEFIKWLRWNKRIFRKTVKLDDGTTTKRYLGAAPKGGWSLEKRDVSYKVGINGND